MCSVMFHNEIRLINLLINKHICSNSSFGLSSLSCLFLLVVVMVEANSISSKAFLLQQDKAIMIWRGRR